MVTEAGASAGRPWVWLAGLSILAAAPALVQAQRQPMLSPSVQATITASDNPGLRAPGAARGDVILDIGAAVDLQWRGPRITLDGRLGAHAIGYARHSAPNRVLPEGRLNLRATLLERWLYVDAGFSAVQSTPDPFAANDFEGLNPRKLTTVSYSLAPRLQHEFTPQLSLLARPERSWVRRSGEAAVLATPDLRLDDHVLRLTQRPAPLGGSLELRHQDTRYDGAADSALAIDAWRAQVTWMPWPELELGATLGHERLNYLLVARSEAIRGLTVTYRPWERSSLVANVERRFFGTGFDLELRHRSPFLSAMARAVRRPNAQPTSQLLGVGTSTAALLDAMLTTREPDAVLRAAQVRQLMAQLNLPETLQQGLQVYVDSARLEQAAELMLMFQGRVTTLTLSANASQVQPLDGSATSVPDVQSSRQRALGVSLTRRLDPLLTAGLEMRASRIEGLGARSGEASDSRLLGASVARQLTPRTAASVVVRRRLLDTTAVGQSSGAENSLALGVTHRF